MISENNSYVYFALKGYGFNPDDVTRRLNISPTKVEREGEAAGDSSKKSKLSAWYLYSGLIDNLFVNKLVEDVVEKLFDKINIINLIKEEFNLTSMMETVLYVDENDKVSTPVIGQNLKTIQFLFNTNTETDVDIYTFNSLLTTS